MKKLILPALSLVLFAGPAARASKNGESSLSGSISHGSTSLERIVDEELGIVCYYSTGGQGKALSCLPLPTEASK